MNYYVIQKKNVKNDNKYGRHYSLKLLKITWVTSKMILRLNLKTKTNLNLAFGFWRTKFV